MTNVAEQIVAYFDLSSFGGEWFTWDDPVKGIWGNTTYVWAGDVATDITQYAFAVDVDRGRSRELDDIVVGTCRIMLRNRDARFLPDEYLADSVGNILLDENGDELVDENGDSLTDGEISPYGAGNLVPGKRIEVRSAGHLIFSGRVDDWNFRDTPAGDATAELLAIDDLGRLGRRAMSVHLATAGQTPGERFASVLSRSEVSIGSNRDIDDGYASLQADIVDEGTNALNYCQLVAKTDRSRFFASRAGVITNRDRNALATSTVKVAFADDGSGCRFAGITLTYGSEVLYTDVTVTREGGTTMTVVNAEARERYDLRTLPIDGVLFDTDAQSYELAQFLAETYGRAQPRISEIVVNLDDSRITDAQRGAVCALDMADTISVAWTPTGSSATANQTLVVEGISHSFNTDDAHIVRISCTPLKNSETGLWDDAVRGLWDSAVWAY